MLVEPSSKAHVKERLEALRRELGSWQLVAKELGVSPAYLSYVVNGRCEPGDSILEPLDLERVVFYRRRLG